MNKASDFWHHFAWFKSSVLLFDLFRSSLTTEGKSFNRNIQPLSQKINWQFHGNKTTRLKQKGKHNITWKQSNNLNKHPGDIFRGITYPALVMCVTRLIEIIVIIVNLGTSFEEKTTRSWFKQVKHIPRYWQKMHSIINNLLGMASVQFLKICFKLDHLELLVS